MVGKYLLTRLIYFLKLPVVSIVFCLFYIVSKSKRIKLLKFDVSRIGHCADAVEVNLHKIDKTDICFVYLQTPVANQYLTDLQIQVLKHHARTFILWPNRYWASLIYRYQKQYQIDISIELPGRMAALSYKYYIQDKLVHIPDTDISKGIRLLEKLGIPEGNNWVCLANRDAAYLKKGFPKKDYSRHDYRDFPIGDMKLAAKYFSSKGLYVVRMGAAVEEGLDVDDPKIIDYATSDLRSGFLDVYLMANCSLFFGSNSGIISVSTLFRKPVSIVNVAPLEHMWRHKYILPLIFKRYYDPNSGKFLSIDEIYSRNLHCLSRTEDYRANNITVVNNSSQEILDLARESYLRVFERWEPTKEFKQQSDRLHALISKKYSTSHLSTIDFRENSGKKFSYNFPDNLIGQKFLESIDL